MMRNLVLALGVLVGFAAAPDAVATSIEPLIWEQLATGADYIGVVECHELRAYGCLGRAVETAVDWSEPHASGRDGIRVQHLGAIDDRRPQQRLAGPTARRTAVSELPVAAATLELGAHHARSLRRRF